MCFNTELICIKNKYNEDMYLAYPMIIHLEMKKSH